MPSPLPFLTNCDDEAAQWAVRIEGGALSQEQRDALGSWLVADAGNEARLQAYRELFAKTAVAAAEMPVAAIRERAVVHRPALLWRWATGFGAIAATATVIVLFVVSSPTSQTLATAAVERRTVHLSDGTQAELNALTRAIVRMDGVGRQVKLERGEIFFSVSKDPARPFVVETPTGLVRVIGTKFNVRSSSPTQLEVTVLEGLVEVIPQATAVGDGAGDGGRALEGSANDYALKAGDQIRIHGAHAERRQLDPAITENVLAWRKGQLVFDATPLAEAIARYAEFHGKSFVVAPEVADLPVGGRYGLDDLDGFLRGAEKMMPVHIDRSNTGKIHVSGR